jgi:transposase-like protein
MSKRLTDKERAEVVTDYASGKTKSEIARKFKVSPNAISKILNKFKSSKNKEEVQSEGQKKDNKKIARIIYERAMEALERKINYASATELLKIIDYYDIKYNFSDEHSEESITGITITIEDASGGNDAT